MIDATISVGRPCWSLLLIQIFLLSFKVGGVDPKQLAVYEEFARNVPGFLPTNDSTQPTGILAQPMKVEIQLSWLK